VSERRTDRIPRGLKRLIGEVWDRAASYQAVRTGLGLLCAAQEALSVDMLAELRTCTRPRWSLAPGELMRSDNDGRRVVSASDDWTLKVWDLEAAGAAR
jgi:hypothetical protein